MDRIALLLKSYGHDLAYAGRLVASFDRFNVDGLALHCVVPRADLDRFAGLVGPNLRLYAEEDLLGDHLVSEPVGGLRTGYANQEIVKIAFWEAGLAANYFCVDSDAVFIRPFTASDFMHDDSTPYTVLVQDSELKVEPRYYRDHWVGREAGIRRIMAEVGLDDPIMRTCHGHQVFSSEALSSFRDEFLSPRGWGTASNASGSCLPASSSSPCRHCCAGCQSTCRCCSPCGFFKASAAERWHLSHRRF